MNITQAKKYLSELYNRGCSYHFDEAAVECLYENGLASHSEALEIQKQIDKIYAADLPWELDAQRYSLSYDCPIGYMLHIMEMDGAFTKEKENYIFKVKWIEDAMKHGKKTREEAENSWYDQEYSY
mgnify:FL=1